MRLRKHISIPAITDEPAARRGPGMWVHAPKSEPGYAQVALTSVIVTTEEDLLGHPQSLWSAEYCRRVAYLLTQAADIIEGRAENVTGNGYWQRRDAARLTEAAEAA